MPATPSPFSPCALMLFELTHAPAVADADPARSRSPPPRKPRKSAAIVAPAPLMRFSASIARTPPAVPVQPNGARPLPIVGAAYCGTRITWKCWPVPVVYACSRPFPDPSPLTVTLPPLTASADCATTYS